MRDQGTQTARDDQLVLRLWSFDDADEAVELSTPKWSADSGAGGYTTVNEPSELAVRRIEYRGPSTELNDNSTRVPMHAVGWFANVEGHNGFQGGDGPDCVEGSSQDDVTFGRGGDDSARGVGGDDSLDGGPGNDTLDGSSGDDKLRGRDGVDHLKGREAKQLGGPPTLVATSIGLGVVVFASGPRVWGSESLVCRSYRELPGGAHRAPKCAAAG